MTIITTGSNLSIEAVPELRQQLLGHLNARRSVTVNIERIDRLHSAAIQVLCAFVRDRAEAKGTTRIDAPAEFHAAACSLGVGDLLGLASDKAARS